MHSDAGRCTLVDGDHGGDVEDFGGDSPRLANPTLRRKRQPKSGNQLSWFTNTNKKQNLPTLTNVSEPIEKLTKIREKKALAPDADARRMTPHSGAIPIRPSRSRQISDHVIHIQDRQSSDSKPLNLHQYPPSQRNTSRQSSIVDNNNGATAGANGDSMMKQAVKMFKHAVLHDARNLSGRSGGGLSWNVNSAHEAKVRTFFFCAYNRWRKIIVKLT